MKREKNEQRFMSTFFFHFFSVKRSICGQLRYNFFIFSDFIAYVKVNTIKISNKLKRINGYYIVKEQAIVVYSNSFGSIWKKDKTKFGRVLFSKAL